MYNNNLNYSRTYSKHEPESNEERYNTYNADYAGTRNDNDYNYQSYQYQDDSYYQDNYAGWEDYYSRGTENPGNLDQPYQRESSSSRHHQTGKQNMPGNGRGEHDLQPAHSASYGRESNVDDKWNNDADPKKSQNRDTEKVGTGSSTNATSQKTPIIRSILKNSGAAKGTKIIPETEIKQETGETRAKQETGETHVKQETDETGETYAKQETGETHAKQVTGETHAKQGTGETHAKQRIGVTHTTQETANKSSEGTKDTSIKKVSDLKEEIKSEVVDESAEDNTLAPIHSKGLMGTLLALMGPEALNRKPDPLPPPQPMKLEDEREKYLGVKKNIEKVNYSSDLYFDFGITEEMLEEAYLEAEDEPSNVRDLLPSQIGRDVDKPEFYCKLCKVQTTSMGNFRDHLNGRSHKNNVEAFRMGRKLTNKKKKIAIDPSLVGQKSVSKEMVEGILEPIIGLSYLTEYHSTSGILCVCNLCAVKFDRNIVVSHLTGIKHRLHYMKERKPDIYVHLKKFGGKKSQLSSFLDELSMDVEREDGRGLPTIKTPVESKPLKKLIHRHVYELTDTMETATEITLSQPNNDAREIKTQEAMLARRKPGNISFQDWVNEEFLKVKKNDEELSQSTSTQGQGNYNKQQTSNANNQGSQGNSKADMHSSPTKREFSKDGTPTTPLSHTPYGPPPMPFSPHAQRPGPFPPDPYFRGLFNNRYMYHGEQMPLPDPCPDPYLYRRDPYIDPYTSNRLTYGDTYLDPDPLKRPRRVETYLDPDPLKRVLPKKESPLPSAVVIDYGHGDSGNSEQRKSHRSSLKMSHREGDPQTITEAVQQWERDIQNILGKQTSMKAPNNLAMLSSTYSSSEESLSPVRGNEPQKRRELPFSKSYLESKKLRDLNETRKKATAARNEISGISPRKMSISPLRRSHYNKSISPLKSRQSRPISPPKARHSMSISPRRSRHKKSISPLKSRPSRRISPARARHSRSISPRRSRHGRPVSPLRSRPSRPHSPPRARPNSPLRSRPSRLISPLRSRHSKSISPLGSRPSWPISPSKSRPSWPISPPKSRPSRPISPPISRPHLPISPPISRTGRPISPSIPTPSPPKSRHSRSISPESLWHKKIESYFSLTQPSSEVEFRRISRKEFSPQRSESPLDIKPTVSKLNNDYGNRPSHTAYKSSYETDKYPSQSSKRRFSQSPEQPRKYFRPETPPQVKKLYERNKQIEAILAEPNEEDQVDRIANLLIEFTSSLSEAGCDTHSAMEKLFSETGLTKALVSPKAQPEARKSSKQPTPREKVVFSLSSHKTSRLNRPTLPGDFGESSDDSS